MRQRVLFLLVFFLFWFVFFELGRVLFVLFHQSYGEELLAADWLRILWYGARMDLSMAGYLTLIPGLIIVLSAVIRIPAAYRYIHVYAWIILAACVVVIVADIELYSHWNFRLDATPLLYIGKDTPLSISPGRLFFLILLAAGFYVVSFFLYRGVVSSRFTTLQPADWKYFPIPLLLTALLILPIRGGTGIAPLNTGMVYFHPTSLFANHSAVNVVWNVGYSLRKSDARLPENIMDSEEAGEVMAEIRKETGDDYRHFLKVDQPNILLIILESVTSKTLGLNYQGKQVTPNLTRLTAEGIYFDHFYASGTRTDKGIVALLNGYPTQPTVSVIKFPRKTQTLPFVNQALSGAGYHTRFIYGGDIDFANFRSYLNNAKFDKVTSSTDFPDSLNTSKWGVHDHYVLEQVQEECEEMPRPFFTTVLTLSSHEPFEVPAEKIFEGEDEEALFLNSVHYTDSVLGKFLEEARTKSWWDSTWVIITADHGHRLPEDDGLTDPERYRIPMIWTGGAVDTAAVRISSYADQTGLAATLLSQAGIPAGQFGFSRNILQESAFNSALYIYNNGFGIKGPSTDMVFDHASGRWIRSEGDTLQRRYARAMIQYLHEDFNQR